MEPEQAPEHATEETRNHRYALWVILACAVLLRAVNYTALADGPCLLHHSVSDMAFFAEWRDRIADGDLLTDDALHPMHTWHRRVATTHFQKHPAKIGGGDITKLPKEQQEAHFEKLWDEWYGGKTFHQEPLYPYALALIRAVFGPDPVWVHVFQMLLGLITLVLLHAVTKHHFGSVPALVATGLAALCSPFLYFELFFLRAAPIACATLLVVWLYDRTTRNPTTKRWLLFGACIGIATALKSHFLAFGVLAMALALLPLRKDLPACGRAAGAFFGGAFAALLPVLIRNGIVGAPLFSTSSVGPVTFANSNHASYPGFGWDETPESLATLETIMTESGGSFLGAASGAIGSHASFADYLGLLWTKFTLAWHWVEFPNNVNIYFAKLHSTTLAALPVTFTVITATALVGLVAALLQRKLPRALLLFALLTLAQLVAFYSLGRFRVAMMISLLPLSGLGLAWLVAELRSKRPHAAVPTLIAAALLAWWIERPMPEGTTTLGAGPFLNAANGFYLPRWEEASKAKDWPAGEALFAKAIAARPGYLDGITPTRIPDPMSRGKLQVMEIFAWAYGNRSVCLQQLGRTAEAQESKHRAAELEAITAKFR